MNKDDGISHATGKKSYHPNDYEQGHSFLNDTTINAGNILSTYLMGFSTA
jgi:hypothetical protein